MCHQKLSFVSIILFTILLFGSYSCIKKKKNIPADINCDEAQLCVGNLTNDTIFFDWNSNTLGDTLLPGEVTCMNTGPIHITYDKRTGEEKNETSYVHMINSSAGGWFIELKKCYKRSNFEYDAKNPSSGLIQLYSEE
ncbi:MAG: hypothetical protein H0U95_00700 [Bacteroidetes bacterium]|nr:hypothetical protein [Bacteroidota bacterium]